MTVARWLSCTAPIFRCSQNAIADAGRTATTSRQPPLPSTEIDAQARETRITNAHIGYSGGVRSILSSLALISPTLARVGREFPIACSIAIRCAFTPGLGISATWVRKIRRRPTVRVIAVKLMAANNRLIPTELATACISSRTRKPLVPAPNIMIPARSTTSERRISWVGSKESS